MLHFLKLLNFQKTYSIECGLACLFYFYHVRVKDIEKFTKVSSNLYLKARSLLAMKLYSTDV